MGNNQETSGDNSPNVVGNYNKFYYGSFSSKSKQVKTIIKLINIVGELAGIETKERLELEKDLEVKINNRFSQYSEELKEKFSNLMMICGEGYNEAKASLHSELTENQIDRYCAYLRSKSEEVLAKNNDNPILSLRDLVNFFESELNKSNEIDEYDTPAVEFFLFKELIGCNVFPNPLK